MKRLLLLSLFILITACGQELSSRKNDTTDPALAPFVSRFEQAGKNYDPSFSVGDVPVNFGEIENPLHKGVCVTYTDGTKEIFIKKDWWDVQGDEFRESLIFHELGHCSLGREHKDEKFAVGSGEHKISMMNSTILSPSQYIPNRDAYLKELFTFEASDVLTALSP